MPAAGSTVHAYAVVIDSTCPLLDDSVYLDVYCRGGATVVAPTVGGFDNAAHTLRRLAGWQRLLRARIDLALVTCAADIRAAKRDGRLGLYFHFQGADPIEDDLNLVEAYRALGVGVVQLTYNVRNRVGDGCEEPSDAGLSRSGRQLVARLNEAGVVVDCSHTGVRTT